jgi:hypothetical protein
MSSQGVEYNQSGSLNVAPAGELRLGGYHRGLGVTDTLTNNASGTIARITSVVIPACSINYTITRGSTLRTGQLTIVSGTTFSFTDDYAENAATGVTLSATESAGIITISYSTTNTGVSGFITYSIQHLI